MNKILEFFRTRGMGFWFCCAAAILSVIEAIVYKNAVRDVRYYSDVSFYLALFAFVPFAVLSAFKATERYASAALAVMIYLAFLAFLGPQSGYVGDIIYGATPSAKYILTVVLLILELALSVAAIFMRPRRKVQRTEGAGAGGETEC